jgi:N-acetylglucosamine kinase-like BadF-type ATPase
MELYLGIDGGGTRTRAVLVDATGRWRGEGESGPCNYHNVGAARATQHLRAAAAAAWGAARRKPQPAAFAFIGAAGVKSATDRAQLVAAAEAAGLAPSGRAVVENDLHNALAGGLAGRSGIALIAGTGTNCLGRDASGRTRMVGGWGWLLDDVGGAVGLALAAFRIAAKSADRLTSPTRLLAAALAFLGLAEPDELLARLYARPWTPDELAGFAPIVTRLAAEGDRAARAVLAAGAEALAALVAECARSLDFPAGPEVVLLGGCARSGPPYQPLIEAAVRAACPRARLVEPAQSPLHGAARNVLRCAGIEPRTQRRPVHA